jgi:hypothetical protein
MATYYVRPGGTGSGTGPAVNQAWGTFQAPFTVGSGVTGGDTVYIAPGHYNEKVVIGITNPTSTVNIIGDVTGSQFSGVTAGLVRLSGFSSTGNAAVSLTAPQLSGTSKDFLSFTNIIFEGSPTGASGNNLIRFVTSKNISFTKCLFINEPFSTSTSEGTLLNMTAPSGSAANYTFSKCAFILSGRILALIVGSGVADTTSFKDCLFSGGNAEGLLLSSIQTTVRNCTFTSNSSASGALIFSAGSATFPSTAQNCLFINCGLGIFGTTTTVTEDYNRFISCNANRNGVNTGTNSTSVGASRLDYGYSRIVGLNPIDFFGPQQNSPNQAFGNASGAEATDVMSIAWTGVTPDSGYQTYSSVATLSPTYNPTERNASTITIAPGSTSQSIELYLGATGLTASTSGLTARYNRTRTASVSIPLVARTIAQAWTAGGFAEVDATNMPGVYRLDLPDAALASGADDVTVVVRGASGTNGAVMTIKLSSGGLTSAQTASAVWNALTNDYTTHGTYGWNVLRADQDSKEGLVTLHQSGGVSRVDADIHAIANDTDAATELKGALLHNGTDYISADLLTPVSAATSVHIGPYQLLADGLGADQPLDVNVGTATSIDVQVTDANGTGIDITGATVTAKVYSSAGTLVASYAGTATYADNGRLSFGLTTTVTNTSGTYTVTVTRTTGATDTQIFGPLRLYVRPA